MIYQLYVATSAKIISFETNCCKLQNPAPIVHLVQTWILRVPGSLPLIPWLKFMRKEELFRFSVLSRGCLQVLGHFSLPFSLPLGVCVLLSLILQACVDLTHILSSSSVFRNCALGVLKSASTYQVLTRYQALLLENCCIRSKVKVPLLGAFTPGGIKNKTHKEK